MHCNKLKGVQGGIEPPLCGQKCPQCIKELLYPMEGVGVSEKNTKITPRYFSTQITKEIKINGDNDNHSNNNDNTNNRRQL